MSVKLAWQMQLGVFYIRMNMMRVQTFTDKMAMSLSLLCALHCLASPLIIVMLPTLAALQFDGEAFHLWMVLAVIPTSVYALTMGCKQHKHYRLLGLGLFGLLFLLSAVLAGEDIINDFWEKALTVIGAATIALGHYWNYRLCLHQDYCACPEHLDELSK